MKKIKAKIYAHPCHCKYFPDSLVGEDQRNLVQEKLYERMRQAAQNVFFDGVSSLGYIYGVTTPDLISVCTRIAREEHDDIHRSIARDEEEKNPICHICGKEVSKDRADEPFVGLMHEEDEEYWEKEQIQ